MKVIVKLPEGAKLDRCQLEQAIRSALGHETAIWTLNPVPAIAQLEESLYEQGFGDIMKAWEETAALLGLPPGTLNKSMGARLDLSGDDPLQDRVRAAFFQGE